MAPLTSLILIIAIFLIALSISYFVQRGQLTTKEWNVKIAENLAKQQEIEETIETVKETIEQIPAEEVTKPKKKRKYYPRKPKTSI
jgi:hypothetical protein